MSRSVSVLIPVYNPGELLIEAIDSALAQTGCDNIEIEIIAADDGSTCERTQEILRNYEDRITVHRKENSGPADTRNFLVEAASHDWIAWLDQDDIWLPNKLELQFEAAERNGADFVYTNAELFGDTHEIGKFRNNPASMPEGDVFEALVDDNFITTAGVMVRRQLVLDVGGHDISVAGVDDWDMWLKIAATGAKFAAIPEPVTLYRWHSLSMSKRHEEMKLLRENVLRSALKTERGQQVSWYRRLRALANVTGTSAWFVSSADSRRAAEWYRDSLRYWPFQLTAWKGLVKSVLQGMSSSK